VQSCIQPISRIQDTHCSMVIGKCSRAPCRHMLMSPKTLNELLSAISRTAFSSRVDSRMLNHDPQIERQVTVVIKRGVCHYGDETILSSSSLLCQSYDLAISYSVITQQSSGAKVAAKHCSRNQPQSVQQMPKQAGHTLQSSKISRERSLLKVPRHSLCRLSKSQKLEEE